MDSDLLRKLMAEYPQLSLRGGVFHRSEVHESAEWLRIVGLPRRDIDLSNVPDLTPLWSTSNGTMRLWPIQSLALLEAERLGGLFAPLPVGTGKTLICSLLPDAMKSKKAVILVPAQLKRRTEQETWPALQEHFRLPLEHVTIVSYTQLERAPGDVLERLRPDLIIADEAHYLKNKASARTWRFLDYFKTYPETRFACMSGTFTQRSITDYAHLMRLALGEGSPLPLNYMTLQEWSEALDATDNPRSPGALERLCTNDAHCHEDYRTKFACRLHSTPGVVALSAGFRGTALSIRNFPIEVPAKVIASVEQLRKSWLVGEIDSETTEEVNDDLSYSRFIHQVALGFFLRWDWPEGKRDHAWLEARSRWNGAIRHVLRYNRSFSLASPLLVTNAAIAGKLDKPHLDAWNAWSEVKDRKKPPTVCVWIDPYVVTAACDWAEKTRGIIWYEHRALGRAIAKALGQDLVEHVADLKMDGRPQVLSIRRFSTGVDGLQRRYNRALYVIVPNATKTEQSLGRLHREGQKQDVFVDMLLPITESMSILDKSKQQALRMQTTGFGQQKLLNCTLEMETSTCPSK